MDDVDITTERMEHTLKGLISTSKRPEGPAATGRCLWCDEIVDDGVRWCSSECAHDWHEESRLRAARGNK